jgi:hypothetical protein
MRAQGKEHVRRKSVVPPKDDRFPYRPQTDSRRAPLPHAAVGRWDF